MYRKFMKSSEPRRQDLGETLLFWKELDSAKDGGIGFGRQVFLAVDRSEIPSNQLILVNIPILYRVVYISGGCLGFQPSTVW